MIAVNSLSSLMAVYRPAFDAAWKRVADRARFVLGEEVAAFEREFGDHCGVAHAIGTANGTDALEISLRALGIGAGDRVLTVANAGMYASTAIRACGAEPVYADVEERDMNLAPDAVARALSLPLKPQAIVLTHLYGRMASVGEIADLAKRAAVPLIEDCAQTHGARMDRRHAGSFGTLGCFSFYPTKNLGALGDGGAIVAADDALAAKIRAICQYGWGAKYRVDCAGGRNSRLDELQAAFLRARLPGLGKENARRCAIAARYGMEIANPRIGVPARGGESDCVHLFVVRSARRDALAAHLAQNGVGSDIHYPIPDHRQPAFRADCETVRLPVTERMAAEILTLPCHPGLSDREVAQVISACNSFEG
jgi:dTDP-3-amino-2,3,6-trideoxy-4-keto-D-glucose/dTDP-3-amino-3,4,6-trideoxy-alpha-D-glucose/dTDP-2,6-dideoxy-D-kanosamine transaminase